MINKVMKLLGFGKKDNNMDTNNELSEYSYQWIKGDNVGMVSHFKEIIEFNGANYIVFSDGNRIAETLLDEYTVRVEKGFYEPAFDKVQNPQIEQAPPRRSGKSEVHTVKNESPIAALLKKQKENWVNVDLNLTINLPKRELWDVMLSSFDNAEDEIIEYVTKDLDIDVVRDALKKAIMDIYLSKPPQKTTQKNVRIQNTISEQGD